MGRGKRVKFKCTLDIIDSEGEMGTVTFSLHISLSSPKNFYNQVYDHLDSHGTGRMILALQLRRYDREITFFTVKAFYELKN